MLNGDRVSSTFMLFLKIIYYWPIPGDSSKGAPSELRLLQFGTTNRGQNKTLREQAVLPKNAQTVKSCFFVGKHFCFLTREFTL